MKTLGVVGLGLIGGSFVKAYRETKGWRVLGTDKNDKITQLAIMAEDIEAELTHKNLHECDLLLIAVYPEAAVEYLEKNGEYINPDAMVIDCCGVKRAVCDKAFRIADRCGFTYVGGHPMAGRHFSGYKYSTEALFRGAPMVIVPGRFDDIELLNRVKELLAPAEFGSISVTTAEKHDRIIGFTSQMAHIVSNAYIKSPNAGYHKGFSAGSYRDMTRVAWLNEDMWTELFMDNRDNLINELDCFIGNLQEYRQALCDEDYELMHRLLADGRKKKEETDGK